MSASSCLRKLWFSILILMIASPLFAATTGKITGVVTDKETGEPLPGVNVVIMGTTMGAATDIDGRYFILNVSPQVYKLQATMMGYSTLVKEGVVVRIDRTTTVDFELSNEVLDLGGEVVAIAEREVVRMDVSGTVANLDARAIEHLPAAYSVDKSLLSQAGVHESNYGISIRRGTSNEITYLLDGMDMKQTRSNRPLTTMSQSAIQEIQVLQGGFSAEYGEARSGVVNVVTKAPPGRYSFSLSSRYSPLWEGGLKHFGPNIYTSGNWWEYGRFGWHNGEPTEDRNLDGVPDFVGWNSFVEGKKWVNPGFENIPEDQRLNVINLTPELAFNIWKWQTRSVDKDGNVLYDGKPTGQKSDLGLLNWYGFNPDYNFDASFSGPLIPGVPRLPLLGKTGFLLSYRQEYTMYPFYASEPAMRNSTAQLKLTFQPTPNVQIRVNGVYAEQYGFFTDVIRSNSAFNSGGNSLRDLGNYMLNVGRFLYSSGKQTSRSQIYTNMGGFTLTHLISPKTFYEIKAQYTDISYNANPVRPQLAINTGIEDAVPITASDSPDTAWVPLSPRIGYNEAGIREFMIPSYIAYGGARRNFSKDKVFKLDLSYTSQINSVHQLKIGFQYTYSDILDLVTNVYYPEYFLDPTWPDSIGPGLSNHSDNFSHVYTNQFAAYITDKIEFGGMVLNAGFRADVYRPNEKWFDRSDLWFPIESSVTFDVKEIYRRYYGLETNPDDSTTYNFYGLPYDSRPPLQFAFSPRLGISHPIGADSKIYFNYGHFYQLPSFRQLYGVGMNSVYKGPTIGNPWLEMPRTIQYEVGFEKRLFKDFLFNFAGYYKDVSNDISEAMYSGRPLKGTKRTYINGLVRNIKGFEVNVTKAYGQYLTGYVNLDYSIEKKSNIGYRMFINPELETVSDPYFGLALSQDPDYASHTKLMNDPLNAARQYPGDWRVKSNVQLRLPHDFGPGPRFAGSNILGNIVLSLSHEWRLGEAFSYTRDDLKRITYAFNRHEKNFNRTDLKMEKTFAVAGISASLFMEITNLFNVKNPFQHLRDGGAGGLRGDRYSHTSTPDGANWETNLRNYMDELDRQGKKYGDEVAEHLMPQRYYVMWLFPRDYWLGLKFNF